MRTDEERVESFLKDWGIEAPGIGDALHALLREVREEANPPDPINAAMAKADPRIQAVLRTHGPPNAKVTPETIAVVQLEITRIFKEELLAAGMGPTIAGAFAGMLAAVSKVKVKE